MAFSGYNRLFNLFNLIRGNCHHHHHHFTINHNLVFNHDIVFNRFLFQINNNSIKFHSTTTNDNVSQTKFNNKNENEEQQHLLEPQQHQFTSIVDNLNYVSLISHQEIRQRQKNLVKLTTEWLSSKNPKSSNSKKSPIVLIASSPPQFQSNTNIPVNDCKQNSDFTYFTGLHSGSSDQITNDCVLLLYQEDSQYDNSICSIIFTPIRTKSERIWHGPELNIQYQNWLKEICHDVRPLSGLVPFLNQKINSERCDLFLSRKAFQFRPELVTQMKFYLKYTSSLSEDNGINGNSEKWSTNLNQSIKSVNVREASKFIDQLRLIKSESEIKALKRIGKIGAISLKNTIDWSRKILMDRSISTFLESHIAAKFYFESKIFGAKRLSFPSVCAGGPRSTIIHYGRNDYLITGKEDNCWILTDVGCEDVDGYCCDISRTWPINLIDPINKDKFQIQLQLYQALIGVQHELINMIEIGKTSLDDLNLKMIDLFTELLIKLDLFENSISKNDVRSIIRRLCPHHVSHYIGLDIHDTPSISRSIPLVPGMCFTIEPGLYIPMDGLPIKSEFRNIGLRIEDDILIEPGTNNIINLTIDCPKILM